MSEDEKLLKEAKKLPWEDRLTHKNWKVRNDANIDLAELCGSITDPKDPRLREFGEFSHNHMISDLLSQFVIIFCGLYAMSVRMWVDIP